MKKLLFLKLLVLVACLSSALTLRAANYDFVADRLAYKITGTTTVEVANPGGEGKASDIDFSGVINIPRTVTYNGTTYTVTGIGINAFAGTEVTQVIIPNTVTYIGESAFYVCWSLTSVSIGSGVRTIGDFAFNLCENLRYVICRATTPPTVYEFTFKIMNGSGLGLDFVQLYVPSSAYSSSAYWNQFGNISTIPSLKNALTTNSIEFASTGSYPWMVMADVGGLYAMSGNAGVTSSTSTLTATVTVPTGGAPLSFDFKAWGEGSSYDKCIFSVDGTQQFSYGARDNNWESYTVELTAGTHTLTWSYSKDGSVNPKGDYFAVRNVKLTSPEAYACYTPSNTTLTFYYDGLRSSRTGTTYDLTTGDNGPVWYTDSTCRSVTKVIFNSSFANARPTSTRLWFADMSNLTSITGLSYLNTENVIDMNWMFQNCTGLTSLNLSNFNTANVRYMWSMFINCSNLTSLDLSSFNTANVKSIRAMFYGCTGLTSLNLSNLNTANVTEMSSMFYGCTGLTSLDLSNFNTTKVTNMNNMFYRCSNLTTIYAGSGWNTNAVTSSSNMFYGCTKLVGGRGTTYNSNYVDKTRARIDGGTSNPGYFTEKTAAYVCYTPSNTTLTFYYDNQRSSRTGTTYDLNVGTTFPGWYAVSSQVKKVVFNASFANARPTTTYYWFSDMSNLTSITGMKEYLNTSAVTNMGRMFAGCWRLTSLDVSNFNTDNVTTMVAMFDDCSNLTSLDVSSFNTEWVNDMSYMFFGCSNLTSLDVSGFNTARVIDMSGMFQGCVFTSLDLSNFNTGWVTYMDEMFEGCSALTTIYASSGWTTNAVTSSIYMFSNCTSLVGGKGTTYNSNYVDKTRARIDGGTSNPGYFTEKTAAYVCYNEWNMTLTFYYDNQRSTREGRTYVLNTGNARPDWLNDETSFSVTRVVFDPSFAAFRPTTTYCWFSDMRDLTSITGMKEYLNTSAVTNMNYMFFDCEDLTSLDVSGFNTAQVTDMSAMFMFCYSLTSLDLGSFNTARVTDMRYMFYDSHSLTTIYAGSGWTTNAVTYSDNMFYGCTSLVGGKGTTYNSNYVNKTRARIDGGTANPGYFTISVQSGDVNGDGSVTIADVTALIDLLLGNGTAPAAADVNGDGSVTIADVTALIDMLLGS